MKKLYSLLLISTFFSAKAQNLAVANPTSAFSVQNIDNGMATVVDNQVFNKATTPGGLEHAAHFKITNISASTKTLIVRKSEGTMNAGSSSYFCFDGACFLPGTNAATIEVTSGGATASFSLIPKFDEGATAGTSTVAYEISDNNNGSDVLNIALVYSSVASVKELSNLLSSGAGIYPNPTNSKSYFDVNAAQELNSSSLKIYNSLGSVVSSKTINLAKGKNTVQIDAENFEAGIYFVSLSAGNSKIVKKLTITN